MKINIAMHGMQKVIRAMEIKTVRIEGALAASVYQEGFDLMAKSEPLCPVETGRLRATAYVAPPVIGVLSGITCECGYGTNYGLAVHEMPSSVNWTRPGSGRKFLKRAFDMIKRGYAARLARRTSANEKIGLSVKAIPAEYTKKPHDKGEGWQKARQKSARKRRRK
jgi:hypothetical protein